MYPLRQVAGGDAVVVGLAGRADLLAGPLAEEGALVKVAARQQVLFVAFVDALPVDLERLLVEDAVLCARLTLQRLVTREREDTVFTDTEHCTYTAHYTHGAQTAVMPNATAGEAKSASDVSGLSRHRDPGLNTRQISVSPREGRPLLHTSADRAQLPYSVVASKQH